MSDLDDRIKDFEARLHQAETNMDNLKYIIAQEKVFSERLLGNVIDLFGISIQYIEAMPDRTQREKALSALEELQRSIKETFATERGVHG